MRPPWGQSRALFPSEETGLHRVGLLLGQTEMQEVIAQRARKHKSAEAARKGNCRWVGRCGWHSSGECETAPDTESELCSQALQNCSCPAQPTPPAAHGNSDLCLGYSSRQMKKLIRLLSNLTIWLRHGKQENSDSCSVLQLLQVQGPSPSKSASLLHARSSGQHPLKAPEPN